MFATSIENVLDKGEMPIRKARGFCKAAIKNHYPMWNWVVILGADGGIRTHVALLPNWFRVLSSIPQLTEFAGKKRKLSEDDSTAKRRKKSKSELFLTSKRRNSNPFQNADFSGKMREKQAFLARWRDVGEKSRREQNGLIFVITTGIYGIVLTDFYAKIPLSKKSNRPLPAVDEFK